LFCALLAPFIVLLRLLLATRFGLISAAVGVGIGVVWLLYRAMKTMAFALWEVSGLAVQFIEDVYQRRSAIKESSHATRLL
jgi:hypothetical protein